MYNNIQIYPYEYQVMIMQELFQEAFVKFNKRIIEDIVEFIKSNIGKRMIEKYLKCNIDEL